MFLFTVHIHNEWPKTAGVATQKPSGAEAVPGLKPLSMSKSNLLSGSTQAQRVTGPSKLLASAIPKGPVGTIFFLLPIQLAGVAPSIATAAFPLAVSTGEEAPPLTPIFKLGPTLFYSILFIICHWSSRSTKLRCRFSIQQNATVHYPHVTLNVEHIQLIS
jgi:hypothetical protein